MKENKISEEVKSILNSSHNGADLVLLKLEGHESIGYTIFDKKIFSILLIDSISLAKELISILKSKDVEEFSTIGEIYAKFKAEREKPHFWPNNKPWPPKK